MKTNKIASIAFYILAIAALAVSVFLDSESMLQFAIFYVLCAIYFKMQ